MMKRIICFLLALMMLIPASYVSASDKELIISKEELKHIETKMNELLSDLELKVVEYYLNGKSYQYIADKLQRDVFPIFSLLFEEHYLLTLPIQYHKATSRILLFPHRS